MSTEPHDTYEDHVADPGNLRMRAISGRVDDPRLLVAFLYKLARDDVPTGVLEETYRQVTKGDGGLTQFTNGWLAHWAQDMATRLGVPPMKATVELPGGYGFAFTQWVPIDIVMDCCPEMAPAIVTTPDEGTTIRCAGCDKLIARVSKEDEG